MASQAPSGNDDNGDKKPPSKTKRTGYECEFVEPPPKQFQSDCLICLQILREPYIVDCCGYSFCAACIERVGRDGKPCPYCNQPGYITLVNKGLKRALNEFRVYCPHRLSGCEWEGKLGKLDEHLNSDPLPERQLEGCPFAVIECLHCKEGIRRDKIAGHQLERCPQRPYTCEYCAEYKSTFEDVAHSHWPECKCFLLPCPNKCTSSGSGIQRQQLDQHVKEECPLAVKRFHICPHRLCGCEWMGEPKNIDEHLNSDPQPQCQLEGCPFAVIECLYCKEDIRRVEIAGHQLERCAQRPYTSSEHSRQIMEKAMKVGRVKAKNYVLLLLGFAGAGKTHVLYLLLGEDPPLIRISTPLIQSPVRAVSISKARVAGKQWKRVCRNDQSLMVAESALAICSSVGLVKKKPQLSQAMEKPLFLPLSDHNASESSDDESGGDEKSLPISRSDTLDDIAGMIEHCSGLHKALEVTLLIIIDSGGQPQFLEALPFFLPKRILHVFVQKLNERLKDFPAVELFGEDGISVATPYTSSLSNEQILQHCICSVQSSASAGFPPRLAIIGTHRDLESDCLGETLADKNRRITELLPSSIKQHAIKNADDFIIPINAKTPDEDDNIVIAGLRQSIEDIPVEEAEIPLQWYGMELVIQKLTEKLDRCILTTTECEQEAKALHLSPESMREGLIYLDKLNIIHYYPDILPDIVFCSSQVLLDKISELVRESYRLRGEVQAGLTVHGPEVREFCNQGLVSRSRLSKFHSHYRPGLFEEDDLLCLFSSLFLITKVSEDKYLMPCLLPVAEALAPSMPPPASVASIPPLLLYFPNGGVRLGVFCAFLSYLLNNLDAKWELFGRPGHPIRIFRNSATFVLPDAIPFRVTISDSMSSYLHVTVHIPSEIAPEIASTVCPKILCMITRGLQVVAHKMCYCHSDLESHVSFFCPGRHQGEKCCNSPHPAKLHVCGGQKLLVCCNNGMVVNCLDSKHEVWFEDQPASTVRDEVLMPIPKASPSVQSKGLNAKPDIPKLLAFQDKDGRKTNILKQIGKDYSTFGILLLQDSSAARVKALEREHSKQPQEINTAIMAEWINEGGLRPVTWATLIDTLADAGLCALSEMIKQAF